MRRKQLILYLLIIVCLVSAGIAIATCFYMPFGEEYQVLVMASTNMEPTIMKGEYVLVNKTISPEEIKAAPYPNGDIITFSAYPPAAGGELIVHRAIVKRAR